MASPLRPEHPVYEKIAEMCRPRYFDDVSFQDLTDANEAEVLSVTGMLPLAAGGEYLTIFRGAGEPDAEPALWILITKDHQPKDASGLHKLDKSDSHLGLSSYGTDHAGAAGNLLRLFEVAEPGHQNLAGKQREESLNLLNNACMNVYETAKPEALSPREHEHDQDKPWFASVDSFTDLCRSGPLSEVQLKASPHGGVDITANIWPPLLEEKIVVRVFHHQGPGEELPGHWYGVGDAITSAHAAYVDYPSLCAAYPESSHAFIEHALEGHLHGMCHAVSEVMTARLAEKEDFLYSLIQDPDERAARAIELAQPVWQDSLAGFQGIAMMFTGFAGHD
jgi:hypothetical protein